MPLSTISCIQITSLHSTTPICAQHRRSKLLYRPLPCRPRTRASAGFWLGGVNALLPPEAKKILKI